MRVIDLGVMPYRQAWQVQEQTHEQVLAGGEETVLLVQHPPVITLGRRGDTGGNLLKSAQELERLGVELVHSDRGGDVTFHGPGQIVAYPIIRLNDHRLSVGGYVHRLEQIVIAALAELDIRGFADPKAVGVWTDVAGTAAKICAIGVRIHRGVSLHGLALNVSADLSGFGHIVPCGLNNRRVTSIAEIRGAASPPLETVKNILIAQLQKL